MNNINQAILNIAKSKLEEIVKEKELLTNNISVLVKTLTPEEAIGQPGRRDFPIIEGKERVIEAEFMGARSHVFTDSPGEFIGNIEEVIRMDLDSNKNRAIFIGTLNAVLKKLGYIKDTIHCRNEEPEKCAKEIGEHVLEKWGKVRVGLIGLNPAIAESLVSAFGNENIKVTDRNRKNIGQNKFGIQIWDGNKDTEKLIKESEVIILTGTTIVNGSFDSIFSLIKRFEKEYLIYGVTATGICNLLGLERICFYGRE
ncbi:Rossmann-like domain-containing protein [Elusimicrobiota bacterium]